MAMKESAPRSRLGNVTDRVVDLAVLNVVVGGGLFLGALALLLLREQPGIVCYAERMTRFWVAFWLGAAGSVLAGLWFIVSRVKGWNASRRRFVTALGAAGLAPPVLMLGLTTGWRPLAFLCAGAALLIAGLAMLRAWRWGAYLEIASVLAWSCGLFLSVHRPPLYSSFEQLTFFGFVLLLLLFTFIAPLSAFLFGERGTVNRFAPVRILMDIVFTASVALMVLAWIMISFVFSPDLMRNGQRSRQFRTMAAMRAVMAAVEKYGETNGVYPATQDIEKLARLLEPRYIPRNDSFGRPLEPNYIPRTDGWGRPLEYFRVVLPKSEGYVIRSAGCDGLFEKKDPTAYAYTEGGVQGMERDIVFSSVSGSQWPEGDMPF
jgi:hypothetical protein